MKTITKRNLPLNVKYVVSDKKYIPLVEGMGLCCDNCGKLIANIATVINENGFTYSIGFDCLETLLLNNNLLDKGDIESYEATKKMIPKVIRFSRLIKETRYKYPTITGILLERSLYKTDYQIFYWLQNNAEHSRDNDYIKLKDMDFDFLVTTLRNIFPKLSILIKD